jgi:hypothetical protein
VLLGALFGENALSPPTSIRANRRHSYQPDFAHQRRALTGRGYSPQRRLIGPAPRSALPLRANGRGAGKLSAKPSGMPPILRGRERDARSNNAQRDCVRSRVPLQATAPAWDRSAQTGRKRKWPIVAPQNAYRPFVPRSIVNRVHPSPDRSRQIKDAGNGSWCQKEYPIRV